MSQLISYFHYLVTYHVITVSDPVPGGINYNYNFRKIFIITTMSVFFVSFYILNSPIILFFIMLILSLIPLLQITPSHWRISKFTEMLLESIVRFLVLSGIMKYLYFIYIFWHQCLTYRGFKLFYFSLYTLVLCYILTIRYIFYLKITHQGIPIVIYCLYFFLFIFVVIRSLTEASVFFNVLLCTKFPQYNEILLSELPDELPETPGNHQRSEKAYSNSFLGLHYHSHKHNHPPLPPQNKFGSRIKFGFGLVGLGVSFWAGYNYHRSADAAVIQANAAIIQANTSVRQADLSALQQGIISKEEYYRRHPGDKPKV